MKRFTAFLLAALLLSAPALATGGDLGSSNYTYAYYTAETLTAPPAYTLERSITVRDLTGADSLSGLVDAHVTESAIYVLCADRLLVLERDFSVREQKVSFLNADGTEEALTGMTGVFAQEAGDYYITQADKARVLHFDAGGNLLRALDRPEIPGFESVTYRPTKLVVDSVGRLFVVAKGMYEGIVELRPDGGFSRFYGVNTIHFSLTDLLWRMVATKEQRSRMQLWLPTDFTNLAIDSDGFIFATVQGNLEMPIRRLNAKGENILKVADDQAYPVGDLWTNSTGYGIPVGFSEFIAVDTTDYGMYVTLDSKRARVFGYSEDHQLLFVFGGLGDREGYFRNPVDLDFVGEKLMVLDSLAQSLEIFKPTLYGAAINAAVQAQHHYDYQGASQAWREALSYNHNFALAYSGIGRALLREKEYEEAMEYLARGNDRGYYTKAFEKVRNQRLREGFVPGVCALAGLIVAAKLAKMAIRRRRRARA